MTNRINIFTAMVLYGAITLLSCNNEPVDISENQTTHSSRTISEKQDVTESTPLPPSKISQPPVVEKPMVEKREVTEKDAPIKSRLNPPVNPVSPAEISDELEEFKKEWNHTKYRVKAINPNNFDLRIEFVQGLLDDLPDMPKRIKTQVLEFISEEKKRGDELYETSAKSAKTEKKNNFSNAINIWTSYIDAVIDSRYSDQAQSAIMKLKREAKKEQLKVLKRVKSNIRFFKFEKARKQLVTSIRKLDGYQEEGEPPLTIELNEMLDQIAKVEALHLMVMTKIRNTEKKNQPVIPFDIYVPGSVHKKWRINQAVENEKDGLFLVIVPAIKKGAVGSKIGLAGLDKFEIYELYMLYLKDDLNADLHDKLAALCGLRRMKDQQKVHLEVKKALENIQEK